MIMKKIILLGVAILAFVVTGCNKENAENIKSNLITEMSISIEGSDTKVAVTPTASGLKYEWSGSESVWVFPAEAGQQTPILFSYNSSTGKFTSSTGLVEGKQYFATYSNGTSQANSEYNADGEVKAAMLIGYAEDLVTLPMVSDIFTATAGGTFTNLHHTCGVVEIPLTGSGSIYDIQFNAYDSSPRGYVTGEFDVKFTPEGKIGEFVKSKLTNNTRAASYNYQSKSSPLELTETPQSVYIALLPGEYNNVKLYCNDMAKTIASGLSVTVERGKVHKKSAPLNVK